MSLSGRTRGTRGKKMTQSLLGHPQVTLSPVSIYLLEELIMIRNTIQRHYSTQQQPKISVVDMDLYNVNFKRQSRDQSTLTSQRNFKLTDSDRLEAMASRFQEMVDAGR